ncbi:hypothetical protein SFB93_08440 [Kurthia gibsonii]|nr:hypothetical protein [Kurthia gibsonii]MEB6113056.1 hypothetical protein [Kurthia gibsonii]
MSQDIQIFKEHFKGYDLNYRLIGGQACNILLDNLGIEFRTTKDFDIILLVDKLNEELNEEFIKVFWDFIKKGRYEGIEQGEVFSNFYRFIKPRTENYPAMIELFSKSQLPEVEDYRITPIYISDDVSSLSAIVLDNEYYQLLNEGAQVVDGISIISAPYLILFKAKAWLDLKKRKEEGHQVNSKSIEKHRKDVIRLWTTLETEQEVTINEVIKGHINEFLIKIEQEDKDISSLVPDISLSEIIADLKLLFKINE